MDFNKNDIEYYLLTKDYASLTKEELTFVSEAVDSEEEYNSLRQLLLVMEEAPAEELLVPNPQIKEDLVTAFEKARFQTGVGASDTAKVIPIKEEKESKKKGFIWLSIAASIALLIGVFMSKDTLFNNDSNNQMAQLEQEITKEQDLVKEKSIEVKEELEEVEKASEISVEEVIEAAPVAISRDFDKSEEPDAKKRNKITVGNSQAVNNLEITDEEDDLIKEMPFDFGNSREEEVAFDVLSDNESSASEINIEMDLADQIVLTESISSDDASNKQKDKLSSAIVTKSVSLKDDKELLSMLYTAK